MYVPNNTNVAYDLSAFEIDERSEKRAKNREQQIKVKTTSVAKSGNALKILFGVACVAVIAFAILVSKVQLSEYATQISAESTALELAERENVRLRSNLDNMVTPSKVEEYAEDVLGLQKTQKSQIKYIRMNTESMTEVAEEGTNVFVSIKDWFDGILEYLGF